MNMPHGAVLTRTKNLHSPITRPDHDPDGAQMVPTTPLYIPLKGFAMGPPSGGALGIELANLGIFNLC